MGILDTFNKSSKLFLFHIVLEDKYKYQWGKMKKLIISFFIICRLFSVFISSFIESRSCFVISSIDSTYKIYSYVKLKIW